MSPVFAPIAGPATLNYWEANDRAVKNGTNINEEQAANQRSYIAESGATQSLKKLADEEARLHQKLEILEAQKAEQVALVTQWNSMLRRRDILLAELTRGRQQQAAVAGEVKGRSAYLNSIFGREEFDQTPVLALASQLIGAERLADMLTAWLPVREKSLAELDREVAAYAKQHGIAA